MAIDQALNTETGPISSIHFEANNSAFIDAKEKLPSDWSWKQAYASELQVNRKSQKVILVPYAEAGQKGTELEVWIDSPKNLSK